MSIRAVYFSSMIGKPSMKVRESSKSHPPLEQGHTIAKTKDPLSVSVKSLAQPYICLLLSFVQSI